MRGSEREELQGQLASAHREIARLQSQLMQQAQLDPVTGLSKLTPFMAGDREMVRKMVEETAGKYAAEKKIPLRDCGKEG